MDKLQTTLQEIGLNEREIKVYLAALELGQSTVLPISKKAGLKRTYCYDILADLQKRGLVSYIEQNNRRRYIAEDPQKIQNIIENNLLNFKDILPELRSIYNQSIEKPKVRYFEGIEGVLTVYEGLTEVKKFDAISSPNHIYQYLGEKFDTSIVDKLQKNTLIREIITPDGNEAEYIKNYQKPYQEARTLPQGIDLSTDILIFENKIALTSYSQNIHSIVIESQAIVHTFQVIFDLLWPISKPIN